MLVGSLVDVHVAQWSTEARNPGFISVSFFVPLSSPHGIRHALDIPILLFTY